MVDLKQHEVVKMRLRLAGSSFARIARQLHVAATTVTSVSQGYRRSRRIEAAIAQALGETAASLWPERYRDSAHDTHAIELGPTHRGESDKKTAPTR